MKYRANPVIVDGEIIIECSTINSDGTINLTLQSGRVIKADKGMLARYLPTEGDYFVTQEDGYEYVNPRLVFERKYSPFSDEQLETK